ncbi:MAG: hypothetical protein ACP5KG_02875 [Myxococcota bacterium]
MIYAKSHQLKAKLISSFLDTIFIGKQIIQIFSGDVFYEVMIEKMTEEGTNGFSSGGRLYIKIWRLAIL